MSILQLLYSLLILLLDKGELLFFLLDLRLVLILKRLNLKLQGMDLALPALSLLLLIGDQTLELACLCAVIELQLFDLLLHLAYFLLIFLNNLIFVLDLIFNILNLLVFK
jgi:hypothetical protein